MVQLPQDFIDECFIEEYKKLDDYLQIPNMNKLRGIIASFKDNEKFVFISGLDYPGNRNIDKYNPKLYGDIDESLGKLSYIFNNSKLSSISVDSILILLN